MGRGRDHECKAERCKEDPNIEGGPKMAPFFVRLNFIKY